MVRKRSKRYLKVESEESDSDDFYEENSSEDAQPKKYSLRQRRGANFVEDFDYDLIEEAEDKTATTSEALRSDDEEFDVKEAEVDEELAISKPRTSRSTNDQNERDASLSSCTITKYKDRELEPEIPKDKQSSVTQSSEDMIDFEDVIRADILVNKSRIDYDSIIEKTEIKLEKKSVDNADKEKLIKVSEKPVKLKKNGEPPKKRGRKPKQPKLDDTSYENFTHESENTGLPINSVLGVTESLYELAERYHMQGGSIEPLAIMKENISTESTESGFIENENESTISLQEPEAVSEAIETF